MIYDDYEDFSGEEYEWEPEWEPPRDITIDEAKRELTTYFDNHKEEVLYLRQIVIFFEKEYYHWITARAVSELVEEGRLGEYRIPFGAGTKLRFIFHRSHRYYKRQAKQKAAVVGEFSKISKAIGWHAENLFSTALMKNGFKFEGENINEFRGRKWRRSNHNLDFIILKDKIPYGCEVKNTLEYIDKEELDIKLEVCDYLDIRPLFIMRYAPKNYIHGINTRGGFALLFKTQVYPLGQEELVGKIKEILELPVICSKAIPGSTINRFLKWHENLVNSKTKSHKIK